MSTSYHGSDFSDVLASFQYAHNDTTNMYDENSFPKNVNAEFEDDYYESTKIIEQKSIPILQNICNNNNNNNNNNNDINNNESNISFVTSTIHTQHQQHQQKSLNSNLAFNSQNPNHIYNQKTEIQNNLYSFKSNPIEFLQNEEFFMQPDNSQSSSSSQQKIIQTKYKTRLTIENMLIRFMHCFLKLTNTINDEYTINSLKQYEYLLKKINSMELDICYTIWKTFVDPNKQRHIINASCVWLLFHINLLLHRLRTWWILPGNSPSDLTDMFMQNPTLTNIEHYKSKLIETPTLYIPLIRTMDLDKLLPFLENHPIRKCSAIIEKLNKEEIESVNIKQIMTSQIWILTLFHHLTLNLDYKHESTKNGTPINSLYIQLLFDLVTLQDLKPKAKEIIKVEIFKNLGKYTEEIRISLLILASMIFQHDIFVEKMKKSIERSKKLQLGICLKTNFTNLKIWDSHIDEEDFKDYQTMVNEDKSNFLCEQTDLIFSDIDELLVNVKIFFENEHQPEFKAKSSMAKLLIDHILECGEKAFAHILDKYESLKYYSPNKELKQLHSQRGCTRKRKHTTDNEEQNIDNNNNNSVSSPSPPSVIKEKVIRKRTKRIKNE